jgi:hypothetical protein
VRVFISHAHADQAFAEEIGRALEAAGHEVWSPDELLPGDNWAEELGGALRRAEVLVALVSPDALASKFVAKEWEYALGQKQFEDRLIPVAIRRTAEIPWILKRLQLTHASSPEVASRQVLERLTSIHASKPRTRASS